MTYAVDQTISAADYTAFRGDNGPDTAYTSDLNATQKLAALIGVGYGQRGYGQVSTAFSGVSIGDVITAAQWNAIFSVMGTINTHTGAALTIPSPVVSGGIIQALDGTSSRPNLPALVASLDASRNNFSIAQMAVTSVLSSVRTTSWNTSVYHEFTAAFASENDARYFFNSGGQLYLSASRAGGTSTTINSLLTDLLNAIGTIRFGYNSTTYTGTGGMVYPIGYYSLTTSYQNIFYAVSSSPYSYYYYGAPLSLTIKARSDSIGGVNGGNGSTIRIQLIFETGLPSYDSVDGTLTSSVSQLKSSGVLAITSPTYTTTSPL
jgi:hypothetical protein